MAKYYGRFKIGGKWSSLWHRIDGNPSSKAEAFGKFTMNTRYRASEVQITTKEPKKYAGRHD